MRQRLLGLILLLLLSSSFATVTVNPIDLTFAVPLVAVIVVVFIALMNMLSQVISEPRLTAWAKTELRELIVGVILIVIITTFIAGSSGISIALTGETDYIQKSVDILDSWIGGYDTAYMYIIAAATKIRSAATYSPYLNVPLWYVAITYASAPLSGIAMILTPLNLATQSLTNIIFLAEGVRLLVVYLKDVTPPILLPLAYIVRLIPFTRKTGNTLMAVAIAGYIFLPFSIILTDVLNGSIENWPEPSISNIDALDANPWGMVVSEPMCETEPLRLMLGATDPLFALIVCLPALAFPPAFAACFNVVMYTVYPIISTVFQVIMTVLIVIWEASLDEEGYATEVFNQIEPFLSELNSLVLIGYLDFILIALITIVGARSLSAALGGEWYMAGVQRLI